MPAIPKTNRYENNRDSEASVSGGDASFSLFPDILRGAAYVSSGGRVYRLFSEEDETTILNSPLGAPLRIDPITFEEESVRISPESLEPDPVVSGELEEIAEEQAVEPVVEDVSEPLPKTDDISAAFAFAIHRLDGECQESERPISVTEAVRRKRGVEGICGGVKVRKPALEIPTPNEPLNVPPKESVCIDFFDKEPGVTPRLPLRLPESERPTLPISDVLPNPPLTVLPLIGVSKAATGKNQKPSAAEEFVLKLFEAPAIGLKTERRLVPSSLTVEEPKEPIRESTAEVVPEPVLERKPMKIVRVSLPKTAKVVRPFTPRKTFNTSLRRGTADPVVTETVPEPYEKVWREHEHARESRQEAMNPCRLHWNPVWPMHLDTLEQDAASQIRSLVDHMQTQFEQGRKVISFNGYRPGDGCTTMALCAARKMAERGFRLLLADAHRQHPELTLLLELDVDPHIYEIMTLIPDRLELLPWSESFIEVDSHDAGFHGERHTKSFSDIVVSLRDGYDGIILDGGSLIESPLSERVAQWRQMQTDGVLLVVNTKNPEPVNVQAVARRLHQFNIELLGVAENYV